MILLKQREIGVVSLVVPVEKFRRPITSNLIIDG